MDSRTLALVGLLATAPASPGAAQGLAPGDHAFSLEFEGETREYDVHVPPGYDGSQLVPLVLDFHGFGSSNSQQAAFSGFREQSDAEGFIVAYPDGFAEGSWNAGDLCCGTALNLGLDDVGLARAIVDEIKAMANIDRRRVYATGISNGGAMSHLLACEASDVFAATAPVSFPLGLEPLTKCQPARPIPVMHLHGFNDETIPYLGGSVGGFFNVASAAESFEYWGEAARCDLTQSEVTFQQGGSSCKTFTDCFDGLRVSLCSIVGPHVLWFNDDDVNIADVAWDFLREAALPQDGIAGQRLVVRDKYLDPAKRKITVVSKDLGLAAPLADPSVTGGQLDVYNPTTGEVDRYPLPAENWKGLGRPAGSKGYKYLDQTRQEGPCKLVLIKPHKVFRAVCIGEGISYDLDEPAGQGSIGVHLAIGGQTHACLMFDGGATILKDTPALTGIGSFKAKSAPAPTACTTP